MTVRAADPGAMPARQTLEVTVPNRGRRTMNSILSQTLTAGKRFKVRASPDFEDPDGNPLRYNAVSDNTASVRAGTDDHLTTVRGVVRGDARITVRGSDPDGLSARQAVSVTVPNGEPVAMGPHPSQAVPNGGTVAVGLSHFFYDSDGDPLTHAASSSGPATARIPTGVLTDVTSF
ncbi:MAG: hypothetical protein OXI83_16105, partial [Gemmatimonadota bacterium]|nr:hypothetical protein [Gemmatimonadota bacterium]